MQRLSAYLYESCLGRPATAQEMSETVEPCELAYRLFQSDEFHATSRFVAGLYLGLFQKAPEYVSWELYRKARIAGENVAQRFLDSAEHVSKFRGKSDAEFVDMLFCALLVRHAEPHEIGQYVNRAAAVEVLLSSSNYRTAPNHRLTAFLLYAALLRRESSAKERDYRAAQLAAGVPLQSLIAEILDSPEFGLLLDPGDRLMGMRERVKSWPVVGYLFTLIWSIFHLPRALQDLQDSNRHVQVVLQEHLALLANHAATLRDLLAFRDSAQAQLQQLTDQAGVLRSDLDMKGERRSVQDAQQWIQKLNFQKADRRSVAELDKQIHAEIERLAGELQMLVKNYGTE